MKTEKTVAQNILPIGRAKMGNNFVSPKTLSEIREEQKPKITLKPKALQAWMNSIENSSGVYFLDLKEKNRYSMQYMDNENFELLQMDYKKKKEQFKGYSEPKKEFLQALLFDLSLFENKAIIVFDKQWVMALLKKLKNLYREYSKAIDAIMNRLIEIDVKQIFQSGTCANSRIKEFTVHGISDAMFTEPIKRPVQGAYELYQIYAALLYTVHQFKMPEFSKKTA